MSASAVLNYGVATAADIEGLTGRQFVQAIIDGALPAPPIARSLTFWLPEAGDGFAVFEGEPGEHLLNPLGIVHGGWA
jgi:acyl-coenzyme A thioesterase PaaI-like protein